MDFSEKLDFLNVLDIAHMFLFTLVHSACRLTPSCRQSLILHWPMTMWKFIPCIQGSWQFYTNVYRLEKFEKLQIAAAQKLFVWFLSNLQHLLLICIGVYIKIF